MCSSSVDRPDPDVGKQEPSLKEEENLYVNSTFVAAPARRIDTEAEENLDENIYEIPVNNIEENEYLGMV